MKISLSWLRELVDFTLSPEDLADKLSLSSIGIKQQTQDYLELDLTYNRGDLLSLRGIAYEVSAITDAPLKFLTLPPEDFIWVGKDLPKVTIKVESEKLCPVYCVAKIENLKPEPSPREWVKKLNDCGIRSIDTITDITNLVMLEYGQTIHAFDAVQVADETMIVRLAKDGEEFKTLDGKVRKLTTEDLLIADPKGILSLSGIMGGKDSEITQDTNTILLEVAIFDPISIRKTSQRFGIHSEASKRIQHGLSKMRLLQALDAAIRMYQDLGGRLTAINLVGDFNQVKKSISLSIKKVNSLLGIKLDEQTITQCLKKLNFTVNQAPHIGSSPRSSPRAYGDERRGEAGAGGAGGEAILEVIPPYFRMDINIEEDLIEEVARMYGYEKIEGKPLDGEKPEELDQSLQKTIYSLKSSCKEAGLTEVQTYSFYSTQVLSTISYRLSDLIKIANPISNETGYLRKDLWPNLVEVVGKNIRVGYKDIAIFEVGKTYQVVKSGILEEYRLAIALVNGSDNPIQELASVIASVAKQSTKLKKIATSPSAPRNDKLFHPTRFSNIKNGEKVIGEIAEIHPRVLNQFGIEKRVAILEIDLESLI